MELKDRKLGAQTTAMLNESDEERINFIWDNRFIKYPVAEQLMEEMEELLGRSRVNRPPCMLLLGRSDNGKTDLLEEFQRRHPIEINNRDDLLLAPVIKIQTPPTPSQEMMLDLILGKLGVSIRTSESTNNKLFRAVTLLPRVGANLILIDEIGAMSSGGSNQKQAFLNTIKFLSNELKLCFVVSGVPEVLNEFSADPQFNSRFPVSTLPRWGNDADYRRFLLTLEQTLPLRKASLLHKGELPSLIFNLSNDGTLGDICKTVKSAAEYAIKSGDECISADAINNCKHIKRRDNADLSRL
ncbi:Bacterial TniB protein [Ferriphaselus amnicola]|uniref:Bacterial TniB protein n=1 Tax=Ferriphaselus amnicola TaxID=1188319 RepID=A0A2Z6GEY7_9PROT|nr:TniB family NTP-binding protein [Ferriphaselus amnicola]BBE51947.1 Bacterial TniB protein [Ferriphaselus amnicola]